MSDLEHSLFSFASIVIIFFVITMQSCDIARLQERVSTLEHPSATSIELRGSCELPPTRKGCTRTFENHLYEWNGTTWEAK